MGGDVSKNFRIVEHIDLSGFGSNPTKGQGFSWSLARAIPTTDGLDSSAEIEGEEFSVFDYGENHIQYSNALKVSLLMLLVNFLINLDINFYIFFDHFFVIEKQWWLINVGI